MSTDPIQFIDPSELAFDIDGVVADTMEVFVQLARERCETLKGLSKEDLVNYDLHSCLKVEPEIVNDLICLTLDDDHTRQVPPVADAPEVLTELAGHGPLRFITARIWPESIIRWLHSILPAVPRSHIQVIATGAPEAKLKILRDLGVTTFVEDRWETCRMLAEDGLRPLLFDQPWNRGHSTAEFPRIHNWQQLRQWIRPVPIALNP